MDRIGDWGSDDVDGLAHELRRAGWRWSSSIGVW
jgi:hypothetical protein